MAAGYRRPAAPRSRSWPSPTARRGPCPRSRGRRRGGSSGRRGCRRHGRRRRNRWPLDGHDAVVAAVQHAHAHAGVGVAPMHRRATVSFMMSPRDGSARRDRTGAGRPGDDRRNGTCRPRYWKRGPTRAYRAPGYIAKRGLLRGSTPMPITYRGRNFRAGPPRHPTASSHRSSRGNSRRLSPATPPGRGWPPSPRAIAGRPGRPRTSGRRRRKAAWRRADVPSATPPRRRWPAARRPPSHCGRGG